MLINVIREKNRAVPFVPYQIRTISGDVLQVPNPDFIFVAPKGSWVEIVDDNDSPRQISSIMIEEVAPIKGAAASRRSKRAG